MSELAKIIAEYKDRHGQPSDASIARAIGVAPQTLDSWLNRGMRSSPRNTDPLRELARLVGLDYSIIAQAVAVDIGLMDSMPHYEWPNSKRGAS